jgi:hypothetical protein
MDVVGKQTEMSAPLCPTTFCVNTNMGNRHEIAKVYRKVSLKNQPSDFAYWQSKSYEERLAALEEIRQEYHGWENSPEQRLQRVYTIVKR